MSTIGNAGVYKFGSPNGALAVSAQGANKEDLLDQIVMIDPFDTPWVSQAPKTTAKHVYHQWLNDTLGDSVNTDTAVEGDDFGYQSVNSAPNRLYNLSVILRQDIGATETQRAVDSAGFADVYAYELQKATKRLAIKLEKIVFSKSDYATGDATTAARTMRGLDGFIGSAGGDGASKVGNWAWAGQNTQGTIGGVASSAITAAVVTASLSATATGSQWTATAGTAGNLTSGDFNDMLERIYRNGGNPEQVYVSPKVKRQISAFTLIGSSTASPFSRNIAAIDKKLVSSIDFYDTDFGIIQIVLDRWVPESTNTASGAAAGNTSVIGAAFFLQRSMNRLAWLRPMQHQFIGKRGDSVAGIVVGECTLEVLSPKANGIIRGINNASPVT